MSKSKQSGKIVEDQDGTFYCLKCGQAGFKTKSAGYGHLTTCKGYKSAVKKIQKEILENSSYLADEVKTNQLDEAIQTDADDSHHTSASVYTEMPKSGPPVGHPRATLRATLRATHEGHPQDEEKRILKLEIMSLKKNNELLQKLAFNHNQHYPQVRQNFSGPQDMVNSAFGDLMQDKTIRFIVSIGAIVVLLNFLADQFDKLDKKSKNRRK